MDGFGDSIVVPLSQRFYVAQFIRHVQRISDTRTADFEVQRFFRVSTLADHHRSVAAECEQRDRFVARGWTAQEVDPASFGASVLVAKQSQNATAVQHFLNGSRAAIFGQNKLPVRFSEIVDESVQIRIVQGPSNGIAGHSKQACGVTAHFKIPKMARYGDQGTIVDQVTGHLDFVDDVHIVAPVGVMYFARSMRNLTAHHQQVIPHLS